MKTLLVLLAVTFAVSTCTPAFAQEAPKPVKAKRVRQQPRGPRTPDGCFLVKLPGEERRVFICELGHWEPASYGFDSAECFPIRIGGWLTANPWEYALACSEKV